MAPTFQAMKHGYANLWQRAEVTRTSEAAAVARGIIADRERYEATGKAVGKQELWPLIGAIHNRESSRSFSTHLHNGDPLRAYTVHEPPHRPQVGHGPPFTWEESAEDALRLKGWDKIEEWPLERWLFEAERYNGWGYLTKINSPYLWSGTTLQQNGKYVADHVWDASVRDSQLGVVAILKAIFSYEPGAYPDSDVPPPPPQELPTFVPNQSQVVQEIVQAVLPIIEQQYVILTKAQIATMLKLLKGV